MIDTSSYGQKRTYSDCDYSNDGKSKLASVDLIEFIFLDEVKRCYVLNLLINITFDIENCLQF